MRFFGMLSVISVSVLCTTSALARPSLVFMHELRDSKTIVLSDVDGRNQRIISPETVLSIYPEITSNGRYVSYSRGIDETKLGIAVLDLQTNITEEWTPENGMYLHSTFSGDGRFLAFSGPLGETPTQRIGIIDLKTERPLLRQAQQDGTPYTPAIRIVESTDPAYFPALSSSGSFLIYQRSKGQTKDIVKLNLETGDLTQITDPSGYAMAPALSKDDRYVVFTAKVEGNWDLYMYDLRSDQTTRITATPSLDYAPHFKPDGGIVFAGDTNGNFELYQISSEAMTNGTFDIQPLVQGEGDFYAPSVSGDLTYSLMQAQSFPTPERSSFGAIAHNGKVYMAGGHQGPEHTYPPESFMNRLEIYDPSTGSWRQGADLSLARHGFSLAAHGNYLYAFGGFTYSEVHKPKWKSVDLIERYDIAADQWEVVGHLPRNRSSNVVAQVGTKVYLMGGWDSTPPQPGSAEGKFHDEIDVVDLETMEISTLDVKVPLPKRRALSAVVRGDEVILIGGLGEGASHFDLLDHVTAFDTKTQTWRELPKLPFATFAPAAGLIGNELYVFGGMFKTGQLDFEYVNHVYKYRLGSQSWQHTGHFLSETKGFGQVVYFANNTLGILGGHTYVGDEDHPVSTFEVFQRQIGGKK